MANKIMFPVTVSRDILQGVNEIAKQRGVERDAVIEDALSEYIQRRDDLSNPKSFMIVQAAMPRDLVIEIDALRGEQTMADSVRQAIRLWVLWRSAVVQGGRMILEDPGGVTHTLHTGSEDEQ